MCANECRSNVTNMQGVALQSAIFLIYVAEGMSPQDSPDFSAELVPPLPGMLKYPDTLNPLG